MTRKITLWIAAILFGLSLILILFFNAVESVAFNPNRYYKAYQKYGQPEAIGMSLDDLMDATLRLLDYMRGKADDILIVLPVNGVERQVFNERERLHMVDVRALTMTAMGIRWAAVALAVLTGSLLFLLERKNVFDWLAKGYLAALKGFGVVFGALGIYMLVDFSGAFWNFHLLLFDNDYWLLDPADSVMINMFPEAFFNDLAITMLLWVLFFLLLPAAAAIIWRRRDKIDGKQ